MALPRIWANKTDAEQGDESDHLVTRHTHIKRHLQSAHTPLQGCHSFRSNRTLCPRKDLMDSLGKPERERIALPEVGKT